MKKVFTLVGLIVICFCNSVKAQSIPQLAEQLVLDIQKLSELKSILSDLYKGYEIVDKGYTNIKNIVSGNFDLHKAFLDGLLAVSPAVKNYQKIADIINSQEEIIKEYTVAKRQFQGSGVFSPTEMNYISNVYGNLLNLSLNDLGELTKVLTASELRMSDYERLTTIDRIGKNMDDKLSFLRSFNSNTSVQALQRQRDLNDIGTVKSLYGINN
jgi:hypothetical protein